MILRLHFRVFQSIFWGVCTAVGIILIRQTENPNGVREMFDLILGDLRVL